jgi:hypothetical protein
MLLVFLVVSGAQSGRFPAYSVVPLSGRTVPGLPAVTSHICVDQFGYLPNQAKVAVIANPVKGYNSFDHYACGSRMELRTHDGKTVLTGAAEPWKAGQVDPDSGDQGWWFDFSSVTTPGRYYVYDPSTQLRSPEFSIGSNVFEPILKAAARMYYYQREGAPLTMPYVQGPWVDGPTFPQDAHARSVVAKDDASTEHDMSGGWMDAGDTDKYPPFNCDVLHALLYAYSANPQAFGDDFNIPESGNGRPDILDEVKYQLDWLLKMQFADGGVASKVGNIDYSGKYPLPNDTRPRYYVPKDSGATITACGIFAHAARVYDKFPVWRPFAATLRQAALSAWTYYKSHPRTYNLDTGEVKSGISNTSAGDQDRREVWAAIHMFALTGDDKYQASIRQKAGSTRQLSEYTWSPYEVGASESLVDYLQIPNADPAIVQRIRAQLVKSAASDQFNAPPDADLYRSWMQPTNYHWGSNQVRACWGVVALLAAKYGGVDPATKARLIERAAGMLHSFHGVNPLGVVYLSNMGHYGAEHSLQRIYHARYGDGTAFSTNPPPGYVVGGPNQSFDAKAADGHPSIAWIREQPRGKAYADFNLGWPESSWELAEPAIYYQAMYVRLVAEFASAH